MSPTPPQEPDEVMAQYAVGGPVAAAQRWLSVVVVQADLAAAWPLTDAALRGQLAGSWVDANADHAALRSYDREGLTAALATPGSDHELWPAFSDTQIEQFRQAWSSINLDHWGWASRPRLIAPGVEIALLVDAGGPTVMEADAILPALGFVMRHEPGVGWLMSGFEDRVGL